jgi:hypothetical protein
VRRRNFLTSVAAAPAALSSIGKAADPTAREYYELRKYKLHSGPGQRLTDHYLAEALVPALNRMGMSPIGAFSLDLGPETPTLYLLIPSTSLESLVTTEQHLMNDDEYRKTGEAFVTASAAQPPFERIESNLMIAFEGWPKIVIPPVTAQKGARVFQLRTYESPTIRDHQRKVEMFHSGEFDFFRKAGFWQVFFGDALIGQRLPKLTYMLSYPSLADQKPLWSKFSNDPDWKKLSSSPKFSFESIVNNVDNLVLNPTSYSQI